MDRISIALCVNNERGQWDGALRGVAVGLEGMTLGNWYAASHSPKVRLDVDRRFIAYRGQRYPIHGYGAMVGNIFWNEVRMELPTAAAFLTAVRETGHFTAEDGLTSLFAIWDDDSRPFTADDLKEVL